MRILGGIARTLPGALAHASYLVASHVTPDHGSGMGALERTCRQGGIAAEARTAAEFAAATFGGLELIAPDVVLVSEWRRGGR